MLVDSIFYQVGYLVYIIQIRNAVLVGFRAIKSGSTVASFHVKNDDSLFTNPSNGEDSHNPMQLQL